MNEESLELKNETEADGEDIDDTEIDDDSVDKDDSDETDTDDTEESTEEDDSEEDETDDDFYDEDDDEEEDTKGEETEETEPAKEEEETEEETHEDPPPAEEDKKTGNTDAALAEKVKKLLEKNGLDVDKVDDGLDTLLAEMEGKTLEEYRAENAKQVDKATTDAANARKMIEADIAELKKSYPDIEISDIRKIPNFDKFARFRDAGLNATEAFAAANPNALRESGAKSAKQANINSKNHLKSNVPSGGDKAVLVTSEEVKRVARMSGLPIETVRKRLESYARQNK